MTQTNTTSLQPAVAASHEDAQQGSTSTFRDLITPELIARARDSFGMSFKKKYAEVIDSRYTVKLGPKISHYEYRVLQFLEKIPDVQTPRPFDFFSIEVTRVERDTREESSEIWHVIIMSTIPGKDFGSSARGLTRDQLREILEEALRFVDRIDSFIAAGAMFPDQQGNWHPLIRPTDAISHLDGGRCLKLPLYPGLFDGQVRTEDFVSAMSEAAPQPPENADLLVSTLKFLTPTNASDMRFCHMDLHCGNIMVLDGKVSGIIDWEFAGWYTRRLEVVGGVKDLVSRSELPLYKEAWTISDKFEQHIIRSLPRLLRGFKKVDRERINAARLIEAGDDPFKEWRERQTRVRMAKS